MPDIKMRNTDLGPLSEMFTGLGTFAGAAQAHVSQQVLEDGADFMRSIVPHDSDELADSIQVLPVTRVLFAPGETAYRGAVGSPLAKARFVDMGTGVDGPFKTPVIVTRPSRKGNRPGVMRFTNDKGKTVFTRKTKFNHSNKIKASKGFVKRTDEFMRLRTEQLVGEMKFALKDYTQIFTGRSVRRPR
jgi:hypothetical protein